MDTIKADQEKEPIEEGVVEKGPIEKGPIEKGPIEKGPIEKKPIEKGPIEKGPVEKKTIEKAPIEKEPVKEKTFEEVLTTGNREELDILKSWLFSENIRIKMARNELEHMQQKFVTERKQFQDEMKELNQRLMMEKKRLKEDSAFFEKKMEILKGGFSQLDMDKRKFEKEKAQFFSEKEAASQDITYGRYGETVEFLFRGVNSQLSLKKRYKDLIKMFHPDNIAGDHEIVLVVNKIYEKMRNEYEYERQA